MNKENLAPKRNLFRLDAFILLILRLSFLHYISCKEYLIWKSCLDNNRDLFEFTPCEGKFDDGITKN